MSHITVNMLMWAKVMGCLRHGDMTTYDLAEETGCHLNTAQGMVLALYREGVVYVDGWRRDKMGRAMTRTYSLRKNSSTKDVPKPPPLTSTELSRQYRDRRRRLDRDRRLGLRPYQQQGQNELAT